MQDTNLQPQNHDLQNVTPPRPPPQQQQQCVCLSTSPTAVTAAVQSVCCAPLLWSHWHLFSVMIPDNSQSQRLYLLLQLYQLHFCTCCAAWSVDLIKYSVLVTVDVRVWRNKFPLRQDTFLFFHSNPSTSSAKIIPCVVGLEDRAPLYVCVRCRARSGHPLH